MPGNSLEVHINNKENSTHTLDAIVIGSDRRIFTAGIQELTASSEKKYGKDLLNLTCDQKPDLVVEPDTEAAEYQKAGCGRKFPDGENPDNFFNMMKQLTLWRFTPEPRATKALRYYSCSGRLLWMYPVQEGG